MGERGEFCSQVYWENDSQPKKTSFHTGLILTRRVTNEAMTASTKSPIMSSNRRIERVMTLVGSVKKRGQPGRQTPGGELTLVEEEQDQKDVCRREKNARPERNLRNKEVDGDRASQELSHISEDDGAFGNHVERVKKSPAVEHLVARAVVQRKPAVRRQVCEVVSCGVCGQNKGNAPIPDTVPRRVLRI